MKVVFVSYHFYPKSHNNRPLMVFDALHHLPRVTEIHALAVDFDHIGKKHFVGDMPDVRFLHVPAYKENISWQRIASYRSFARQVAESSELADADIVYVNVPDYLSAVAVIINKSRYHYKVVIDVVDLWPEALPLPKWINFPVKTLFKWFCNGLRRRFFNRADLLLFQSSHFMRLFGAAKEKCRLLPMCTEADCAVESSTGVKPDISERINILYLGSLNYITDIDSFVLLVKRLSAARKTRVAVVGGGVGLPELQRKLAELPVETVYHGITFDESIKRDEFEQSHFGYNGYRQTTEVAVSYKSMEYLCNRLPILNSARGDSLELVEKLRCGFNFTPESVGAMVDGILALDNKDYSAMSDRAAFAYEGNFSHKAFSELLSGYVDELTDAGERGK